MTAVTGAAPEALIARPAQRRRAAQLPWITVVVICAVVLAAAFAPFLSPYDPYAPELTQRLQPPTLARLLGTDTLGHDVLTRLMFGARVTLFVVGLTLLIGGAVGILLGVIAGYFRGIADMIISRMMDAVFAFPSIFFGMVLAVTLGAGVTSVCIAISLVLWARFARIIRDEMISLRERDFIARAKVSGCSGARILFVHILPNIVNAAVVIFTINIGYVILMEASLSYLGAGRSADGHPLRPDRPRRDPVSDGSETDERRRNLGPALPPVRRWACRACPTTCASWRRPTPARPVMPSTISSPAFSARSAPWRRRWAASTPWYSAAAWARTRGWSGPGSARGWAGSASRSTRPATPKTPG